MRRHLTMWAVIILALAAVMLMIRVALADEPVTMWCISSDSYVNVREAPSTKSKVGGRLDFGDAVEVTGSERDGSGTLWYRVNGITEQGYGWVCSNYLIDSEPAKTAKKATVCASGRVAVYKRVNGARKTWAKAGSTVEVSIESTEWCLTDRGWIRTEYLEEVNE